MNTFTLYTEPQKTFSEIFKLLQNAKKSIWFETFEIGADPIGEKLISILSKKSKDIKVEGIVDSYDFYPTPQMEKQIEKSPMKLHIFHPIRKNIFGWQIKKAIERIHIRTHRKVTIIDEKVAFVGGTNYSAEELEWRDIMVKITGPIVTQLLKARDEIIPIATKHLYAPRKINKKLTKKFKGEDTVLRNIPLSRHRPIRKEILRLIRKAAKEITIVSPYFVTDAAISIALNQAVKRGIQVKVLIPKKSDHYSAHIFTQLNAFLAQKRGIQVYEYPRMIHSKYVIVDDTVTFGSANFNNRSFNYDYELNIITKQTKLVKDFKRLAKEDLEISTPFKATTWQNRGIRKRIMQKILAPIKKYF